MATLYNDFLKKANSKAKQNRKNRVINRTAPYKKGLGKSHTQYIAGDLMSSAKNRAWGYRKNNKEPLNQFTNGQNPYSYKLQQEGKNPYEFRYVQTPGKRNWVKSGTREDGSKYEGFWSNQRLATDEEKEVYKKTGGIDVDAYNKKHKYSWFSSYDRNADEFREHFNTPKLDGLEVAKNKVKAGGSKLNYLGGLGKDIIVDPLIDALRIADAGSSTLFAGALGGVETLGRLSDKQMGVRTSADIDWGLIGKNFKQGIDEVNKEGWGLPSAKLLKQSRDRDLKYDYDDKLKALGKAGADEWLATKKAGIEKEDKALNITGLGLDILNPIEIGSGIARVGRKVIGNTAGSFKDLVKGTSDLSMGIVPKSIRDANQRKVMKSVQEARNIVQRSSDDIGNRVIDAYSDGRHFDNYKLFDDNVSKVEHELNKSYDVAMSKSDPPVAKVIKSNPETQNLGRFLDEIDRSKLEIPKHIDRDAYKSQDLYKGDDIDARLDDFLEKIDGRPDEDYLIEQLQKTDPEMYNRLMGYSDTADNVVKNKINRDANDTYLKSKEQEALDLQKQAEIRALEDERKVQEQAEKLSKIQKHEKVTTDNAVEELLRILTGEDKMLRNNKVRSSRFANSVEDVSTSILKGDNDYAEFLKEYGSYKGKVINADAKRTLINNRIFGGKEIIVRGQSHETLDKFIKSFEEISNIGKVIDKYNKTGKVPKVTLSKETRKLLGIPQNRAIKLSGDKLYGVDINSPEDLVKALTKMLSNNSRGLTDTRYSEKLSLLANKHGYKSINTDVREPLKKLQAELKQLDKSKKVDADIIERKIEINKEIKRLRDIERAREKDWYEIRNLTEEEFDKFISQNYPEYMKDMEAYKKVSKESPLKGYKEAVEESADKSRKVIDDDKVYHEYADESNVKPTNDGKGYEGLDTPERRFEDIDIRKNREGNNYETYKERRAKSEAKEDSKYREDFVKNLRTELRLKYFKPNPDKLKIPEDVKNNYNFVSKIKELKPGFDNLKKLIAKEVKLISEGRNYDANLVRNEMKYIIQRFNDAGIDVGVYKDAMSNHRRFVATHISKPTKVDIDPLEKMGLSINGKRGIKTDKNALEKMADARKSSYEDKKYRETFFTDEFERILENPHAKDLLNSNHKNMYPGEVVSSGDNIGKNLPKETPLDKVEKPKKPRKTRSDKGKPRGKRKPKETPFDDDFNPLDKIASELDIDDVPVKTEKVRKKKTQAEIDEINKTLERYNNPSPLEKINIDDEVKRLPKLSELMELGYIKDEAIEILEKMKKGELELPSHKINNKVNKNNGWNNTTSSTDMDSLEKILNKTTPTKIENKSNIVEKVHSDVKYGEVKETKLKPGQIINEGTGEVEDVNKYLLNKDKNTHPDVYDNVVDEVEETTSDIAKQVDEEKMFEGFNESIGDNEPSFEKFKKFFKDTKNNHMNYEDNEIFRFYKRWLNSWKKGFTVYNPGWHVQNFLQNKGQNFLAFGPEAFAPQKNAKNLNNYIKKGKGNVQNVVSKDGVVYNAGELKKLVKEHGVINSQSHDVMESSGLFPKLEGAIENSWLLQKLGSAEDTSRLYHFIKQLERGMSPEDASKSVNKYLFDYENKSKFDKIMGDFVDPFWVFHKNYARLMGQSALENPDKVAKIMRGERGLEDGLEDKNRNPKAEEFNRIQSPFDSFKDDVNGKTYDYLYKQNVLPRFEDAIPMEQEDFENKLNPLLRIALQQSRGEGNFHNKIVDKDKAGWNEVTKDDRNKEIASEILPTVGSLAKFIKKKNTHQSYADNGTQSQDTTDKQVLHDWLEFILGNKANYYSRK